MQKIIAFVQVQDTGTNMLAIVAVCSIIIILALTVIMLLMDRSRLKEKRIDSRLDIIEEKLDLLTRREKEIALNVHLSEKDIAKLLNIAPATVKKTKSNIYSKLGIHKATELIQIINGLGKAKRK